MKSKENFEQFYNSSFNDKFTKLAKPIADCCGLDVFAYTKVERDGSFFQVSNHPDVSNFYWNSDLPLLNNFIHHPDIYCPGTRIVTDFSIQPGLKKFYNPDHLIIVLIKDDKGMQWVCMSTKNLKISLAHLFMQEQYLLEKFALYFLEEWKPYISKLDPYFINIQDLLGDLFFDDSGIKKPYPEREAKMALLKKIGLFDSLSQLSLTERELECLNLLLKGKSATQIAKLLYISPRTVETHLEHIKNKMACFSKSEVVEKARELQKLGLL